MSEKKLRHIPTIKDIWQRIDGAIQRVASLIDSRRLYLLFGLVLMILLMVFGILVGCSAIFMAELVIGLLCGLLALFHPRFSLVLVFIGAGLPALLINLPGHTMRLIEPALYLCILVIILRRPPIHLRLYHLLALLFVLIALISFFHVPQISTDPDAYAADKRLYEVLLMCEAFFCGTCLIYYIKENSALLSTLLLCNIPLYLIGLAQAVGLSVPAFLEHNGAQDPLQTGGRLWGPTDGAVTFGAYLVNLLSVGLACYILGQRRRDRIIGGLMTLATTLEIIGSGTRSAALAAMVIIFALLLITRRYKLLLGLLSITVALVALFFNSIVPLFSHDQTSILNRLQLWHVALKLIVAHPLVGIGLQQFYVYYRQLIIGPSSALNQHGISVHNQYLELALESGLVWLVIAIAFLLSIFFTCWHAYRGARREEQVLLLAALLALLANIVIGFFDVPLDKVEGSVMLFLLLGLGAGSAEQARRLSFFKRRRLQRSRTVGQFDPLRRILQPLSFFKKGKFSAGDGAPNTRKTVRTITFQLVCWMLTGPIILPVTALLTHYLGPVQYGEYGFTLPFLATCALLSGTGMDPLIIRLLSRLPRQEWSETLSYAAGSRCLLTALSVGTISLFVLLLPFSAQQRYLLLFGCFSLFFNFSYNGLRVIYSHGFRAEQRVTLLILLETIDRLLTAAMVVVVVVFRLPLLWAYVLIIYADLPCAIALMLIARQRFGIYMRLSLTHLRTHVLGSLALTGYDALALLTGQADVVLLMLFTGPLNVGLYALAIRISDPLLSVAYMYINGIYPLLCATFEKKHAQFATFYREAIRIVSLAIIPPSIFMSMQADTVVSLLGGQHFAAATIVVPLLMWATVAIFYSQLAVRGCMAANLERWVPYVAGIVAAVNLVGNFILIPLWQAVGAGIASLVSEMMALMLFMLLLRRHTQPLPTLGVVLQVALGNGLMLAFLLWQRHTSLILTIPISLVLTLVGCFIVGALSWRDVQMARRFLFSRYFGSDNRGESTAECASDPSLPAVSDMREAADYPTQILATFRDIADYPTLILPRIRL